jgi:hypothetical protein
LDEVPQVMATQGIELTSDQKTQKAEMPRPPHLGVDERLENVDDARTLNQLTSQIQLAGAGWATSAFVQGSAHLRFRATQRAVHFVLWQWRHKPKEVGEHGRALETGGRHQFGQPSTSTQMPAQPRRT